jgi:ATP-dependent Clp protease, protease subunit
MAQNWYAFKNAPDKDGEVELSLYDEIGSFGIGAKEFIAELKEHKDQHIHLRINSPGGEIVEGSAIYNALTRHKGGLTVHIDALAASMASVIAMSGDPVYMSDNALLMIHNPWTLAAGEAKDLRKQADLLDTMKSNLIRAYQKKSGMEEKAIAKLMDEETWLDAVEAVALGFVDAIEDGIPAAASAKEMRARFDNFAKAKMQNTVISEAEVSAPAADPVVEETPVAAEVVESVTDAPVVEEARSGRRRGSACCRRGTSRRHRRFTGRQNFRHGSEAVAKSKPAPMPPRPNFPRSKKPLPRLKKAQA